MPVTVPEFKTCEMCGSVFARTKNGIKLWLRRRYCSRACSGTLRDDSLPKVKNCVVCSAQYHRPDKLSAYQWKSRLCCSVKCAAIRHSTHGDSSSREYTIWTNMKSRCLNPKSDDYSNYGGRGITICAEWVTDFAMFLADMGRCPKGKSLDRKDTNRGYCRDNCKWSTTDEQCNNRRNNIRISVDGRTQTLMQWSKEIGFNYSIALGRFNSGHPIYEVFSA